MLLPSIVETNGRWAGYDAVSSSSPSPRRGGDLTTRTNPDISNLLKEEKLQFFKRHRRQKRASIKNAV